MNLCEFDQCNICLENGYSTVSIQNSDGNNIKWFTKLQFTIPELEWLEEYLICDSCVKQLEKAWEFKKLVLNLETERRLSLAKKELYNEENDDFRDSCDTADYIFRVDKDITCDICFKPFTTQTQLRQHVLQNHNENQVQKDNSITVQDLFTCYDCNIGFSTKNKLLSHITNDHNTAKAHTNFTTDVKLSEHIHCETQFQCGICKEFCSSKKDYNTHLSLCKVQVKESKPLNQFGAFENKVWSLENVNNLTAVNKTTVTYNCDICSIKFDSPEEYNAHNSLKHDLQNESVVSQPTPKKRRGRKPHKIFSCEICGKQFDYVKLVVEHCISEHGMEKKSVKPYTCEKCEMRFASSANLDQHRHYHDKNRMHVCSLCGKGFITKSDLTVHEYTHYNRRNYKCSKCDKAFNTNKNLRTHDLVVHTDRNLWKYGCSICKKRFPLKTNYEQHLRRHTGEKKYVCHICRKPFISKTEMTRHINLHSNIKAFKCSLCDKEYKERRTYEMHLTKIHGIGNAKIPVREKKFVCHICPSQFYDRQKLSKHLCSHSGLKPFACYACEKKFTDKSYLKHHLKTAHNIIEPTRMDLAE